MDFENEGVARHLGLVGVFRGLEGGADNDAQPDFAPDKTRIC